jgi:N-acetylornithine carbamoyltransferase
MFQCGHAAIQRHRHVQQLGPPSLGHDLARAPSIRLIRPAFRFFFDEARPCAGLRRFRPGASMIRHFLNTQDLSRAELDALLDEAACLKQSPLGQDLAGRTIALLFFNPSMRTRSSFEIGAWQLGAHAVVLAPGKDAWGIEFEPNAVMDGDAEEHVAEVAQVLSRYCDLIGVRAFPKFRDWAYDREDKVLKSFAQHSRVPVINLETITHPCQELAHALTLREKFGKDLRGKKYLLTWTWHPKPLNTAVANSALTIATRLGMDVTLLCPNPDYILDERYLDIARQNVGEAGGSFRITHDIEDGYRGADVVYAKSWGALPYFGAWEGEAPMRAMLKHFIVDEEKMALTNNGLFSHCLPLRRNIKATDGVMDAPYCVAVDEAENRLHVQKAVMKQLIRWKSGAQA